jgi:hypothetical protein
MLLEGVDPADDFVVAGGLIETDIERGRADGELNIISFAIVIPITFIVRVGAFVGVKTPAGGPVLGGCTGATFDGTGEAEGVPVNTEGGDTGGKGAIVEVGLVALGGVIGGFITPFIFILFEGMLAGEDTIGGATAGDFMGAILDGIGEGDFEDVGAAKLDGTTDIIIPILFSWFELMLDVARTDDDPATFWDIETSGMFTFIRSLSYSINTGLSSIGGVK